MENLIIYSIIFFIILIALVILYISLNPLEIKEKTKETFVDSRYEEDVIVIKEPTDFQGTAGIHYEVRPVAGSTTNEKYIIFRNHSSVRFPDDFPNCSILVVGGGGAGATRHGGGGGAGAVIYETNKTIYAGTYSIIIGSGGAAVNTITTAHHGFNGNDTSISLNGNNIYLAKGGGGGLGSASSANRLIGSAGSSGGGGCGNSAGGSAVSTNIPSGIYGFSGGYGTEGGSGSKVLWSGGGGGGAGAAGTNSSTNPNGYCIPGNGGIGKEINITGIPTYYGGGGGGGGNNTAISTGLGGAGGGGTGTLNTLTATAGTPNTGGGGGGGGFNVPTNANGIGGSGGSGVVIIRYTPIVVQPPPYSNRNASSAISNVISSCIANVLTENPRNEPFDVKTAHGITGSDENYVQSATTNDNTVQYTVKFSSYANPNKSPLYLFDYDNTIRNNTGVEFKERRYNQSSGHFISSVPPLDIIIRDPSNLANTINNRNTTEIPDEMKIRGEWVSIKFPTVFNLIGCSFIANIGWENKAPGSYLILGRNTITNSSEPYTVITSYTSGPLSDSSGRMSWENYNNADCEYAICLRDNTGSYNEYLFVFPRLAYTDKRENVRAGHQLHFKEIRLIQRAIQDDYSSI